MFYPQLVAGPIERPEHMLHQFHEPHFLDYGRITSGLRRMAWGLFKKVVVADQLAFAVSPVYAHPTSYDSRCHILATGAFAYQIYCDFSGYSDIAVGAARVMGFELTENFARPYSARSLPEFWHRWHISLSTWFRDYVYIPLGGSRHGIWRTCVSLSAAFLLSGLWHGAKWTFVIWGAVHGLGMVASRLTQPIRKAIVESTGLDRVAFLHSTLQRAWLLAFVLLTWVFFRANSLADALVIFQSLLRSLARLPSPPWPGREAGSGRWG